MSRFIEIRSLVRLSLIVVSALSGGCLDRTTARDEPRFQVVYVTTPDQCLSCSHAWELFECLRDRDTSSNILLATVLLCERLVVTSGVCYSAAVLTVVVSTSQIVSPLYVRVSKLGDYQLFLLSDEKALGYWKGAAIDSRMCDSILHSIEQAGR